MIVCQCFNISCKEFDLAIDTLKKEGATQREITPGRVFQQASSEKTFAKNCASCKCGINDRITRKMLIIPA